MQPQLEVIEFRDRARAAGLLSQLERKLPEAVLHRVVMLLASSPAPDQALRGLADLGERQPAAFERLVRSKLGLQLLVAVFSYSRFLGEEVLQHPEWLKDTAESGDLDRAVPAEEIIKYHHIIRTFLSRCL